MLHRVYLVPGFFGFANLGEIAYFAHVHDAVARAFAARGQAVALHVVRTWPTASLRRRAARLLETVAETAADDDAIHLIGHSSGGLDARLATVPGVDLGTAFDGDRVAARVRTVVTVATPHGGTPLASFFASVMGQRALKLLSLGTIYVIRFGQLPLGILLRLGSVFARLDDRVGLNSLLLDQLFAQLLGDFTPDRRTAIEQLFGEVEREQDLLPQLMPESMDVFAALAGPRPGVRYGCVVTRAREPGVLSQLESGLDPSAHATHGIYQALYRLTAQPSPVHRWRFTSAQQAALAAAYGEIPPLDANDGVVPTRAQVHGDVVAAVRADHLDILGHLQASDADPPHYDWLSTGTGYDCAAFEATWAAVVGFLLAGRS